MGKAHDGARSISSHARESHHFFEAPWKPPTVPVCDYPGGGVREIRDLNRNLQIDPPDTIDPFTGIQLPPIFGSTMDGAEAPNDEFLSMRTPTCTKRLFSWPIWIWPR